MNTSGLHHYTIGQREGLGIGGRARRREAPWYVCRKGPTCQQIDVSQDPTEFSSHWLTTSAINWLVPEPPRCRCHCTAKIRYRQADQSCRIHRRADGGYWVDFDTAQRAVTPGQYVCLYLDTQCLGGGVIERTARFVEPCERLRYATAFDQALRSPLSVRRPLLVHRIANGLTTRSREIEAPLTTSIFATDPRNVDDVYGRDSSLRTGVATAMEMLSKPSPPNWCRY